MDNKEQLLEQLLKIGVVKIRLNPENFFTWSSRVRSPIYCDNRKTISYPLIYKRITEAVVKLIKYHHPQTNCVGATATAAIPLAAWIANKLSLPLVYVRKNPKTYGTKEKMEGELPQNPKVVVIEDLISTGASVLNTVKTLEKKGAKVLGVYAIFSYEIQKCQKRFEELQLPSFTLFGFSNLITYLKSTNQIDSKKEMVLKNWKQKLDQEEFEEKVTQK